eukprot:4184055-Pleurochrysis_carterae.AAC.3
MRVAITRSASLPAGRHGCPPSRSPRRLPKYAHVHERAHAHIRIATLLSIGRRHMLWGVSINLAVPDESTTHA